MSHIPNNAMPHAGPSPEAENDSSGGGTTLSQRASGLAEMAREHPKTAIAAGAALAAGVAAAAAIPLVRSRRGKSDGKSGGKSNGKG